MNEFRYSSLYEVIREAFVEEHSTRSELKGTDVAPCPKLCDETDASATPVQTEECAACQTNVSQSWTPKSDKAKPSQRRASPANLKASPCPPFGDWNTRSPTPCTQENGRETLSMHALQTPQQRKPGCNFLEKMGYVTFSTSRHVSQSPRPKPPRDQVSSDRRETILTGHAMAAPVSSPRYRLGGRNGPGYHRRPLDCGLHPTPATFPGPSLVDPGIWDVPRSRPERSTIPAVTLELICAKL
jgi:hypothetical protein